MADQAQSATTQVPGGIGDKVNSATSGVLGKIEGWGNWVAMKGKALLDRFFPPEQRSKFLAMIQSFMLKNPKLSAFLGMNFALTGVPLGLFVLFTLTVAIFSLVVGLLLGLLAAVVFILFAVGTALAFVLPVVFFTTMAACFLFLWGLGGYYILRWVNGDSKDQLASEGGAIGDKLNSWTGGRLTGFMNAARDQQSKQDISGFNDQHTKPDHDAAKTDKGVNGSVEKQAGDAANKATKATGVDSTTGMVKGGLKGSTGLG